MKIFFLIVFGFFLSSVGLAQVGGESVYQFLNISTSARQVALGGAVLTLTDDVNQPIWNPAVINTDLDKQLSVNYASYLAGINIGSLSYAKRLNRHFGTVHGSISYLNYGSLISADEQGNELGTFNASDIAVSVGYAYNLPRTNFYIGANLKFINATISGFSSFGLAADIGYLYKSSETPLLLTLVARNIGKQVKSFNGINEKLPFTIALGGSYKLEHVPLKWYVTLDNLQKWNVTIANPSNQTVDLEGNVTNESVTFLGNAFRHFVVGAELFPERAFNIRVGYNFRRSRELKLQNARTFAGVSFGFGLKMNNYRLNYAFSKIHSATNASTFSLQINLDRR